MRARAFVRPRQSNRRYQAAFRQRSIRRSIERGIWLTIGAFALVIGVAQSYLLHSEVPAIVAGCACSMLYFLAKYGA